MSPVPAEGLVSLEVVSPGLSLLCVVVGVCCVLSVFTSVCACYCKSFLLINFLYWFFFTSSAFTLQL